MANAGARSLDEFGFTDDREGVEKLLRLLADKREETEQRYRKLVERLDDEQFGVREAATKELAQLPVIDRMTLLKLKEQMPPEVAMRIEQALSINSPERFDEMITAALEMVVDREMKGLADLMFEALGSADGTKRGAIWNLLRDATLVTTGPEDLDVLKVGLSSDAPMVRAAAVEAISKLAGERAPELLLPVASDPDADVKWVVARELALAKRRECLQPMAELLMCDDFGLRWRTLDELRRITGQEFGYYAAGDAEEREEPAKKWKQWVEGEGKTAELFFEPEDEGAALQLFNGKDITGWVERRNGDRGVLGAADRAARISNWSVDGDHVVCTGFHPGTLQSEALFLNYVLSLEYLLPGGRGDSGIGVFADQDGGGYLEVQLLHGKSGDLYRIGDIEATTATGAPLAFQAPKLAESNEQLGEWNKLELRVNDGAVVVTVNGVEQNRASDCPRTPGAIVIRNEGDRVEFRDMKLRKL